MRKKISVLLIIVMIASLLAACGSNGNPAANNTEAGGNAQTEGGNSGQSSGSTGKKEIIVAQNTDVTVLDPHDCNEVNSFNAIIQINSSLVTLSEDLEVVPDLATEWKTISPTEWEFTLREGVKWHDGSDFKASDVKFSIERQQSMPNMRSLVENIEEVKVIDDYKVVIVTKTPDGSLLNNLCAAGSCIVSEAAVTQYGDDYKNHPVGTGPMKFVSWTPGDKLVLEKNPDYYGDNKDGAEVLIFKGIPEDTARTIALEAGEVDLTIGVEAMDKLKIEENPAIKLMEGMTSSVDYLGFNCQHAPLDNKLVRQAVNYAIDKEAVNIVASDGRYDIANTVVGQAVIGYDSTIEAYPYDPDKAKELLKEAGFENGFDTTLWVSGDLKSRIAQVIQQNLVDVGVNAVIEPLEWSAYIEKTGAGEHDMFLLGWSASSGDGDMAMYPTFHSSKMGLPGNRTFYANPEVDKVLDEARTEVDQVKRNEDYKEAQKLLMDDSVWVPLYFRTLDVAIRADLKGIDKIHPTGLIRFYKLHY